MEHVNPRVTVQNLADDIFWLVRMEHSFGDGEYIDVQLTLPRNAQQGLAALQKRLLVHTQEKLKRMIDSLTESMPDKP